MLSYRLDGQNKKGKFRILHVSKILNFIFILAIGNYLNYSE